MFFTCRLLLQFQMLLLFIFLEILPLVLVLLHLLKKKKSFFFNWSFGGFTLFLRSIQVPFAVTQSSEFFLSKCYLLNTIFKSVALKSSQKTTISIWIMSILIHSQLPWWKTEMCCLIMHLLHHSNWTN